MLPSSLAAKPLSVWKSIQREPKLSVKLLERVTDARQEVVAEQLPTVVGLAAFVAEVPWPDFQVRIWKIVELAALSMYAILLPSSDMRGEVRIAPLAVLPLYAQ